MYKMIIICNSMDCPLVSISNANRPYACDVTEQKGRTALGWERRLALQLTTTQTQKPNLHTGHLRA